jgi:hypothetical protein
MTRTMLIATGVVLVAVIAYFAIIGADRDSAAVTVAEGGDPTVAEGVDPTVADAEAVAEENMSNRVGADAATDEAVESARAGEDPVQGALEETRSAAEATGAVGAAAFTPDGYDRTTVLAAIDGSELPEDRKDDLRDLLASVDPNSPEEMETVLATVRAALEEG